MRQMLKNRLKDQKGFTLIELLAVIVILGIIAAIAIPSILGLIDNTKKDAHVANANQMISAAKMAVANNADLQETGTKVLTLEYLLSAKYLEPIKDPDTKDLYVETPDADSITIAELDDTEDATQQAYVIVTDGKVVGVKLVNDTRGVQSNTTDKEAVDVSTTALERKDVK